MNGILDVCLSSVLGITRGGESISLYHTIYVNNVP
jgi:hypothetical protein